MGDISKKALGDTPTFQVVLVGIKSSVPAEQAKAKLAVLFRATVEQIESLVATPGYVVKRAIPIDVASKYKRAIEAAGGDCEIVREDRMPTLEIDLPSTQSRTSAVKSSASVPMNQYVADANARRPDTAVTDSEISTEWQSIFMLIDKAGGPSHKNIKALTMQERLKALFSFWGFFLGPFYYLVKGMWKKALVLSGLCFVGLFLLGIVLDAMGIDAGLLSIATSAVFATRAKIDYYKKMVLSDNGWW